MARRKLTIKTKLTTSTILEVVISMVIIVLVFGTAMMIYSNVTRLSLSARKMQAQAILQGLTRNMEQSKEITSGSIISGDYTIDQSVKPYNGNANLFEVRLTAYDENHQKVAELQKVILKSND